MVDFAAMAAVKVEEIPEARLLPMGSYIWQVARHEVKETANGNNDGINFTVKLMRPIDEFERPDDLNDYISAIGPVAGETRTYSFYYPKAISDKMKDSADPEAELQKRQTRVMQDLIKFLTKDLGLDGEGLSIGELLARSVGGQFIGQIVYEKDNRNGNDVERLRGTAPVL